MNLLFRIRRRAPARAVTGLLAVSLCTLFLSCSSGGGSDDADVVTEVVFNSNTATVNLRNLVNANVYLVYANGSPDVAAFNTCGYVMSEGFARSAVDGSADSGVIPEAVPLSGRVEFKPAQKFSSDPSRAVSSRGGRTVAGRARLAYNPSTVAVGSEATYEVSSNSDETAFTTITATVRGQSTHANVWVAQANDAASSSRDPFTDDDITAAKAQAFAIYFDKIYSDMTQVFGYEYGGGAGGSGGMDGDARVNILIYDIAYDNASVKNTDSGIYGMFWGNDEYVKSATYPHSNEAELIYLDSQFSAKHYGLMCSTILHEFQHMINFNVKTLTYGQVSDTWYNEMLSMLAEDMMSANLETYLGADYNAATDSPVAGRMPLYNAYFDRYGVTDWSYDNYYPYSTAFGFGAYLARNYGGVSLVKAMAQNSNVNKASVTAALSALGKSEATFDAAFARYGEALVLSSSGFASGVVPDCYNTFDRTVSGTVGTTTYTFPAFDIWTMQLIFNDGTTMTGPHEFATNYAYREGMPGYSYMIQHDWINWENVTGSMQMTIERPVDPDIRIYLIVREAK